MNPALLALVASAVLSPVAVALLRRRAVVDIPNERSSHSVATPRGGGIVPALAATAAIVVGTGIPATGRVALAACPLAFAMLGLADDVLPVDPLRRLAMQLAIAGATVWLLVDDMTGSVAWRVAAAVVAVTWIVAVVNAWNFMDGIDGLAVLTAVVAGGTWWVVGDRDGAREIATAGAILAAAAAGFLPLNFPSARAFLGDVGSYFLGGWSAAVVILGLRAGIAPEAMVGPLVLFLADTGTTLLRRLRRRERIHTAHREHVYQRLVASGWSHVRVTLTIGILTVVCGALGAAATSDGIVTRAAADLAMAAVVVGYLVLPRAVAVSVSRARR